METFYACETTYETEKVVESGNHADLMKKKNFYFNLVSRQISTQEKQSEMLRDHGQNDYNNL